MKILSQRRALIFPPYFWMVAFFVIPMLFILVGSFSHRGRFGGIIWSLSLDNYRAIFDPIYFKAILRSFNYATIATALTLLISYPVAYFISFSQPKIKNIMMFLIILPFWTNFLIRIFSWFILLGRKGLINNTLLALGVIHEPLSLLHNAFSVNIGLIYGELPYMILPIIASLDRMNISLLEASTDLGANKITTFWKVTFPTSLPGVITGIIFVFIPMLGQFVVPDILGGTNSFMIGNVITSQFLVVRDWPFGSAISMLLMSIVLLLIFIYLKFAPNGAKELQGII